MKIICFVSMLNVLLISSYVVGADNLNSGKPIMLKAGPHLLLDNYLIQSSRGVERKVVQPERFLDEPIVTGRPEHQNWQPFLTVLHYPDAPREKQFRMWYNVDVVDDPADGKFHGMTAHMESEDGIHWPGPYQRLDSLAVDGSARFGACVLDEGPHFAKAAERFKILYNDVGTWSGPRVAFSPDGLQWTMGNGGRPIFDRSGSDDIFTAGFDPLRKRYFIIGKSYQPYSWTNAENRTQTKGLRLYFTNFSSDFRSWSKPNGLVFAPDEKDTGITQWYGAAGFQVRGDLIIGFLRVLHDDRSPEGAPKEAIDANTRGHAGLGASEFGDEGGSGMGYTVLTWTRDGKTWERDRHTDKFLEPDPRVGSWDHAMSWVGTSTPVGDEIYLYYAGYKWGHKFHHSTDRQIGLVKTTRDRYVARRSGPKGGTLLTPPLTIEGNKLAVNASAENGEIRVQALDADGKPIAGFSLADCKPISGDSLDAVVEWKKPLASLRGKPIRLEFALKNASLFAIQVE